MGWSLHCLTTSIVRHLQERDYERRTSLAAWCACRESVWHAITLVGVRRGAGFRSHAVLVLRGTCVWKDKHLVLEIQHDACGEETNLGMYLSMAILIARLVMRHGAKVDVFIGCGCGQGRLRQGRCARSGCRTVVDVYKSKLTRGRTIIHIRVLVARHWTHCWWGRKLVAPSELLVVLGHPLHSWTACCPVHTAPRGACMH